MLRLLFVAVGVCDYLWEVLVLLGEKVLVIWEVGLVLIGCAGGLNRVGEVWPTMVRIRRPQWVASFQLTGFLK